MIKKFIFLIVVLLYSVTFANEIDELNRLIEEDKKQNQQNKINEEKISNINANTRYISKIYQDIKEKNKKVEQLIKKFSCGDMMSYNQSFQKQELDKKIIVFKKKFQYPTDQQAKNNVCKEPMTLEKRNECKKTYNKILDLENTLDKLQKNINEFCQ